jgi:hypothetical protein
MRVKRQALSEADWDQGGHRATDVNLHRRSQVRGAHPHGWRRSSLSWTPGDGLYANKAGRQRANCHEGCDPWIRARDRSGAGAGKRRRPRGKGLRPPNRELDATESEQQSDRPSEGKFQDRSTSIGAGAVQRKLLWSTETAGNIRTPRKGSRTAIAAGSNTLFKARRLCAISSRRCARLRSVARARTP